jgi:hypothetical protein
MKRRILNSTAIILTTEAVTGLQKNLDHDSAAPDDDHLKIGHNVHILLQSS